MLPKYLESTWKTDLHYYIDQELEELEELEELIDQELEELWSETRNIIRKVCENNAGSNKERKVKMLNRGNTKTC